jgi:adhesin HecA-like repeat protein
MATIKDGNGGTDQAAVGANKALSVTRLNGAGAEINEYAPTDIVINPVTVSGDDLIASLDVTELAYVTFQLTSIGGGATVTFKGSLTDGTNFDNIMTQDMGVDDAVYISDTNKVGTYKIPTPFKFLNVNVSALTSGTVTGAAAGFQIDNSSGLISATGTLAIAAGQTVATVTNLEQLGGTAITMNTGVVDAGTQRVTLATDDPVSLGAGSNFIGKTAIIADPNVTLSTAFILGLGGVVDVNSQSISSVPATLRSITFTNYAATARHFKLYNTAGTPTAGSAGVVIQCSMPAGGTLVYPLPVEGFLFSLGIGATMTGGAAESNTTPTATAPDFSVSLIYQVV